jgi:hypothetical protein
VAPPRDARLRGAAGRTDEQPDEHAEAEPEHVRQVRDASPVAYAHCRTNHPPSTSQAGRGSGMKKKNGTRLHTRARGNITRYAPSTPAIAPDAPISGCRESGSESAKPYAATIPATR